jgi:predicted O-linked N-acetylglucosamine transferase (SPINDLY family)
MAMGRSDQAPRRKLPAGKKIANAHQGSDILQRGLSLHQEGKYAQAKEAYEQVLRIQPGHFDALHLLGVIAAQDGNLDLAVQWIGRAVQVNPYHASAHFNLGNALKNAKRFDEALVSFEKAVAVEPNLAEAFNGKGGVLKELKCLDEALAAFDHAITIRPLYAEAYNNRGILLAEVKRYEEAKQSYDKAISIRPNYADAFYNRGIVLQRLRCLDESLTSFESALAINPSFAEASNNRGLVLKELGRLEQALVSYDHAIATRPNYAEALNNRGVLLKELRRIDEALACYSAAISINPSFAEAYNNYGNALKEQRRFDEALGSYQAAIKINPESADTFYNQAGVLRELQRLDESLASYDSAISIKPDYAEAFNNRGGVLRESGRLDEILDGYDKAIEINPGYAEAYYNRGVALQDLMRLEEALASYHKAWTLNPDYEFLFGLKFHTQMKLCDWEGFSEQLVELEAGVLEGKRVTSPFPVLGLLDRPDLQQRVSEIYVGSQFPERPVTRPSRGGVEDRKIRVGYFSADFHNHATSFLIAELFEAHDSNLFETYGFSFGPEIDDEMRRRVSAGFNQFFQVGGKSDFEIVEIARGLGIDIAVDLKGFTQGSRMGIFAGRCAPVQVSYLGYPGTIGAPYIDYIVADRTLIPEESQSYYTEKIVYLPNCYQVNDSRREISDRVFTRQEFGLPEDGFVFCCFNNNYKIVPAIFDCWMRILDSVDGSVLWLLEDNPAAAKNLRREAASRQVDSSRLVFAKRMSPADHLARHRLADLFIDTVPCNAHTTMSDALWAGLPALTLLGKSFAGRVAASLLNAVDLPELIAESPAQYECKAIELARNPELLASTRLHLEASLRTSPLFNGRVFALHLEAAYKVIFDRYRSGQDPDHVYVVA